MAPAPGQVPDDLRFPKPWVRAFRPQTNHLDMGQPGGTDDEAFVIADEVLAELGTELCVGRDRLCRGCRLAGTFLGGLPTPWRNGSFEPPCVLPQGLPTERQVGQERLVDRGQVVAHGGP